MCSQTLLNLRIFPEKLNRIESPLSTEISSRVRVFFLFSTLGLDSTTEKTNEIEKCTEIETGPFIVGVSSVASVRQHRCTIDGNRTVVRRSDGTRKENGRRFSSLKLYARMYAEKTQGSTCQGSIDLVALGRLPNAKCHHLTIYRCPRLRCFRREDSIRCGSYFSTTVTYRSTK